jgi:hypothetical protein
MSLIHVRKQVLATNQTGTGAGSAVISNVDPQATFQAVSTTTAGTGSVTVTIEVSNDGSNWLTLGTISLTPTTSGVSDGFASVAPWANYRSNVTAISGTGAKVSVFMGAGV